MDQDIIRGYWPLYEDGAPVRIGDRIMGTFDPMTVESVTVYPNTTNVWSTPDVAGTRDHLHLSPGERVKRVGDAPEGVPCLGTGPDGDIGTCILEEDHQTWHIVIDGVRYGVGNYARRVIAEALDLTTIGSMSGAAVMESGDVRVSVDGLTRTNPETEPEPCPDSWEQLKKDARKWTFNYWRCGGADCRKCPIRVGGKTPNERYRTLTCADAKDLDIVARAKALAGVTGDE